MRRMSHDERQRGHAMIELAVSAGVMVACLAGTVQFGYTFYIYNQLVTAVGNGGRYAAMRTYRAAATARHRKRQSSDPQHGGVRRCASRAGRGASGRESEAGAGAGGLGHGRIRAPGVRVNVSIVDYTVDAVFGMFRFTGKPAVEYPFVGRFAPAETEP